jgi:hypothetical protein
MISMQIKYNILPALTVIIGLGFFLGSCNKQESISIKQEGTIYMPQAFSTRGQIALTLVDSPQGVIFGAAYGGLQSPSQDVNVTFKIDTAAIKAFNLKNGTSYIAFPTSSYAVPALTGVIKAGSTSSVPLKVNFTTKLLGTNTNYMLPITLTSTSSGTLDTSLVTTYFSINKLVNIYDGSYHTIGTRTNYDANGVYVSPVNTIDDTRILTTISADSSSINTIANLGAYNGTVFYVKVKSDNTCVFTGKLQNDPNVPVVNQPGTVSTYNPANKVFTVHYMYTNTNGTIRKMDEVWTPN